MSQSDLPDLILIEIFKNLTIKDLVRCFCVSKKWRNIVKEINLNKMVLKFKHAEKPADDFRTKFMALIKSTETTESKEINHYSYYNDELVDKDNIINFERLDVEFINSILFKSDKLKSLKISNAQECHHIAMGSLINLIDYNLIESHFQYLEHLEMPIHYQIKNLSNSTFIKIPSKKEKLKLNLPLLKILSLYNISDDLLFEIEINSPLIKIVDLQNICLEYLKFSNPASYTKIQILQFNQPNFIIPSILTQFTKLKEIRLTKNYQYVFSFRSTQTIFNLLFNAKRYLNLNKLKIYFLDQLLDSSKNFEDQISKSNEKYLNMFTSIFESLPYDE